MALQPAICNSCGGAINVEDVDLNGYGECEYCKVRYKVIDVITVDGLPTAKSLLTKADLLMGDGNFEKAVELFDDVISIKPNCHEAWWGLYRCNSYFDAYYQYKDKYGNSGPIVKASIMLETIKKYASKAIDYAPETVAKDYRSSIDENVQFIEAVRRGDFDKPDKKHCYIATAVYGSYSCTEVLVLRKFRDECLSNHCIGRLLVRFYYLVGPLLVNFIKAESAGGRLIRRVLDWLVDRVSIG